MVSMVYTQIIQHCKGESYYYHLNGIFWKESIFKQRDVTMIWVIINHHELNSFKWMKIPKTNDSPFKKL